MDNPILSQLEKLAFWLQRKYMAKRRTIEVVESGRVRFHPEDCSHRILLEYKKRLKKFNIND